MRRAPAAGCARHRNVFTWSPGTLASGASSGLSITVKASTSGTGLVLALAASRNPGPGPLSTVAIALISIRS